MNNVVNFILESGVSLSLLSMIYILFLRKETFFRMNRGFLLFSILFSLILPFLKFRIFEPQSVMLQEITVSQYRGLIETVTIYGRDLSGTVEQAIISTQLLIAVYLIGLSLFLGRFIFRLIQIRLLIIRNNIQNLNGYKLISLDSDINPFSFLNYVFISKSLKGTNDYDKILTHELEHIKQGHTFDILILEVLTVFQWFNPFMWLLKRAIHENHEYLADQGVLSKGVSKGQYKSTLLYQFTGGQVALTNNFNYSLIKKRITMMSKIRSSVYANFKYFLGIGIIITLIIVFACEQKESVPFDQFETEESLKVTFEEGKLKIEGDYEGLEKIKEMFADNNEFEITDVDSLGFLILNKKEITEKILPEDDPVFFIVEIMPEFPGGDSALRKYISNSVKYPPESVKNKIQGKVYVTFVVASDGFVKNVEIARGVSAELDKEAKRVVSSLPKWKPGSQRGKNVNVKYTIPISFALE